MPPPLGISPSPSRSSSLPWCRDLPVAGRGACPLLRLLRGASVLHGFGRRGGKGAEHCCRRAGDVNGIDCVAMDLPVTVEDHKQRHPALFTVIMKLQEGGRKLKVDASITNGNTAIEIQVPRRRGSSSASN